jgi:hypothetical protein
MDARRLLLGGVAGLVAVVGAHAAEIPVKAKAVQYVSVCTLYGDGFYFIPGTQTCMKIGGFVRAEIKYDAIGSFEPAINGANAQFFRGGDQIDTRVRTGISLDAREQTAYGTLRAYLLGGWQYTSNDAPTLSLPGTAVPTAGGAATAGATPNGANNVYFARAFVQFAGFTAGKAVSVFDFFDTARYSLQIRTSAASASTHSTTLPSLGTAGARVLGSRTERSTPGRSRISMRRRPLA